MKSLLELQRLDLKIEAIKAREFEIPKQKEKYEIHRKRLAAEIEESEHRCQRLLLEQRECESEVEQKQQQIKKYEGQLLGVKKNEEYQALLHEIDMLKKQIGIKEERIISIMLELDEAHEHLEEDKKRIDAEMTAIEDECRNIDAELVEATGERERIESERKPVAEQTLPAMLSRYERIRRSKKQGAAVVPLRGETCSGCNMTVLAQTVNEVLAGDKVRACHHCGRLLYHPGNFEEEAILAEEANG